MKKIITDNISNIDGLENSTILKTLQNVITYVKENAKEGPQGNPGATGVGISAIENKGTSKGEGFTINHIEATLTDGNTETFDVLSEDGATGPSGVGISNITAGTSVIEGDYTKTNIIFNKTNGDNQIVSVLAKNGKDGTSGGEVVTIDATPTATSGTITSEQLATLQSNWQNVILLNNEYYRLNDEQSSSGYLVYTHVGQDSTNNFYTKCLTITISTLAWVLSSQIVQASQKLYQHNVTCTTTVGIIYFSLINTTKSAYTHITEIVETLTNSKPICSGFVSSDGNKGFALRIVDNDGVSQLKIDYAYIVSVSGGGPVSIYTAQSSFFSVSTTSDNVTTLL